VSGLSVEAALLAGVLCAALAALTPRVVAALPESTTAPHPDDPPRPAFGTVAARPGLAPGAALAAGLAGAAAAAVVGLGWPTAYVVVAVPPCVALAYVDWRTRLLPSRIVLPVTGALVLVALLELLVTRDTDVALRCLVGLLGARSFVWLLWRVRASGMGFGDVRLAALLGLLLGRVGYAELLLGIWLAFPLSSVPWLLVALVRRDRAVLKRAHPFGPFLVLGALVGIVGTAPLLDLIYG